MREHLDKKPFEPFRLFMSDGAMYDVPHSDLCMVSHRTVYVGFPDRKRQWLAARVAHCALMHITRIEPLEEHEADAALHN